MKKMTLFILLTFSFSLYAQENVINNFESAFTGGWGTNGNSGTAPDENHDNFSIVDNPSKTGINTSNKVGKFHRLKSGNWWALAWFQFNPIHITATVAAPKYLHISVYKPIASTVCVQLKDVAISPTVNTGELISDKQTKINEWQDIVYKITITGSIADMEVKPDFVSTSAPSNRLTDDIDIYIDNIVINNDPTPLGETPEPQPEFKGNLPEGFEGVNTLIDPVFYPDRFNSYGQTTAISDLTVSDNPSKIGINTTDKCAKFVRKANGDWWAGVYMIPLNPIVVNETNNYFHIMVYRESEPTPLNIKLENATGNSGDITVQGNEAGTYDWVDYVFQVPADKYGTYDKLDIMPDFLQTPAPSERYFSDALFYFDAIELNNSPTPRISAVISGVLNPTKNKLNAWSDGNGNIKLHSPQNENCSIQLYNSIGEMLNNITVNQPNGLVTIPSNQLSGVILVRLATSKGIFTSKVSL